MKTKELTDYFLKPENQKYVEISLREKWGLSNHIAESNGLRYVHRGVKSIDEKIVLTKEWKNKNYHVDKDLINFIQPFSSKNLSKEKLHPGKIVRGSKKTFKHTLGFFVGFMWGTLGPIIPLDMLNNGVGGNLPYYLLAASGGLFSYGVYSAIALKKGLGTKEYKKFLDIVSTAEDADYSIRNKMSKEFFEKIKNEKLKRKNN